MITGDGYFFINPYQSRVLPFSPVAPIRTVRVLAPQFLEKASKIVPEIKFFGGFTLTLLKIKVSAPPPRIFSLTTALLLITPRKH